MVKMGKLKKRKMRKFSVKEQNIIKHIYEDYKNSQNGYILGNVFWYELNKNGANIANGCIEVNQGDEACERILSAEKDIRDVYFLLSYLEDNRYIYLMDNPSLSSSNEKGDVVTTPDSLKVCCSISQKCTEYIKRTITQRFFITQEFVDLVESNFTTYEDIQLEEARNQTKQARNQTEQAREQIKWSICAVILALISIICAIWVPKCSSTTINQEQFDSIKVISKEMNNNLKTIEQNQEKLDSISKFSKETKDEIRSLSKVLKEIEQNKKTKK